MGKKTTGKKGYEREKNNTLEEVTNGENGLSTSAEDDVEYRGTQIEAVIECGDVVNEKKKKKTFKNGDSVDLSASETEVVKKDDVDEDEKRKKIKQKNGFGGNDAGLSVSHVETLVKHKKEKKKNTKLQEVIGTGAAFSVNQTEAVLDRDLHPSKKKIKKKQESSNNDFESSTSKKEAFIVDDVDTNNGNEEERKNKKRKLEINEDDDENETQKPDKKDKRINSADVVTKVKEDSKQEHLGVEENTILQKNDQVNSENNAELKERKKSKTRHKEAKNNDAVGTISFLNDTAEDNLMGKVVRDLMDSEHNIADVMNGKESGLKKKKNEQCWEDGVGDDGTVFNNGTDVEAGREKEQLEKVDNQRKEKKRKRKEHNDNAQAEKLHNANSEVENIIDNESPGHSSRNEAGNRNMKGYGVREEDGKKNKKKAESVKKGSRTKTGFEATDPSQNSTVSERSKKVSFSDKVQVFPSSDGSSNDRNAKDDGLVRGKRFSIEEDEMIRKAVINYIETHRLGEEGLNMVLHCRSHPEVKNCWKEIGAALPWRPSESIYYRAHTLFERDENRKWTPEELELVRKFHEKHGSNWKRLAIALGKHRVHVKDAWRRIRLPNQKKGQWSQEEYQKLFDLVNLDLRIKASEEKKSKHGMLRDNISWEAISDKLETRSNSICCMKWYDQLTSPMVAEGKWADTDDYHLVNALSALDACCMDDVDWDNLLEHRSGTICRKRWNQMAKHLGPDANKSFPEQVEILSTRYSLDVLEAREAYNSQQQR
ncbi:Myb family transcription factor family protein [Melia azedarach]|uniref:Myb family transcription factor family protein n=1 Tax=Melia azedarach TaxID=155640 RepID=A0ACC1X4Y4_MELAZ|nr:Myb family transcription factor family protein [Melia azedarach]